MNSEYAQQRMVDQQVRVCDVHDVNVLRTMKSIDREHFAPAGFRYVAFADTEIPLAHGQAMLQPSIDGRLLQALDLDAGKSVLEIGTGSGYLTACLATLAGSVVTIDCYEDFVDGAAGKLADLGIDNVQFECMDAMHELPAGKFDAIAVTGAIPRPDPRLLQSLNPGGRMFVFVGESPVISAELVIASDGSQWQATTLFETDLASLRNVSVTPEFLF
jgi:protein-L-isoaspartate(D-aspartate) O-methyltransferase